ncbi:MAG: DedA family protein [Candidatus Dormibacteraeota bacterium]|nr:DedA family protein [Candidatus Dormibacteraeota bacterium]MBV8445035.1 DedA family protein [Candidatus Dormibacteraeota bacterium]
MTQLLATYGYLAVFFLVCVESIGIPLPGETALIAAAVYAGTTHRLAIGGIIPAAIGAAVVGSAVGFAIGWFGGYPLLLRYGRYIRLDERRLKVGRYVFLRRGGAVVFFGRFIVILRTYAAFLAGTNRMHPLRFMLFTAAGAVVWATFWGVLAYLLGDAINRFSTPVDIGLGVLGVAVLAASVLFVRHHARRLEAAAERAFPGPLEHHVRGSS